MRRHHTGSGRATVMSPDWEDVHSSVPVGFMQEATVNLRKPGGTTAWDDGLGRTVTTGFTPFASNVPAQITPLTAEGAIGVVDEQAYVLGYRVSVPYSLAPTPTQLDEGVEVVVVTCADPMLVGATLRVSEVVRGNYRLERDLIADLNS